MNTFHQKRVSTEELTKINAVKSASMSLLSVVSSVILWAFFLAGKMHLC